ncbi:hypothetical protein ACROYT_G032860 [Oculina patagonica]
MKKVKGSQRSSTITTPSQASWDMSSTSSLASGTASGKLGIIQEMTLPHEDFIKDEDELQAKGSEVERVVWPEEIRRYSVPEVIRRARERMGECGEKCYHLTKNNCESFVMWCLCGLNISLQVTPRRKALFEACNAFCKLIQHAILQVLKSAVARGTMRGAASRAQKDLPEVGVVVGAALTVLFEIIMSLQESYRKHATQAAFMRVPEKTLTKLRMRLVQSTLPYKREVPQGEQRVF